MIDDKTTLTVVASFFGVLVGMASSWGIYWHNGRVTARYRLLGELGILRHRFWHEVKPDDGSITALPLWKESLAPLRRAYLEYYRWLFFWQRRRLDAAWRTYKGTDEDLVTHLPSATGLPRSKQELLDRIDQLIAVVR